jgi:hypothetical protein
MQTYSPRWGSPEFPRLIRRVPLFDYDEAGIADFGVFIGVCGRHREDVDARAQPRSCSMGITVPYVRAAWSPHCAPSSTGTN